ncbi:MAG: NADH:ubiquinone reductase (Na(+)-transporting) subunit B [Bacteroidota bacterium]
MKALRNYIDKIKPNFEKGGKYSKLQSTFEAFETLLYVPNSVTKTGAHIRDNIDLKRTMATVVMAMIPPLLFGMYNTGYHHFLAHGMEGTVWEMFVHGFIKVFPIIVVSYVTGLTVEFIFAQIRGHEVNEGFLVSGMLIPLVVPVDIPLWQVSLATIFAVIIGKEVFGGTGMNILNPALTARAFLFFAYPQDISGDVVWVSGLSEGTGIVDGYSGSTILGQAAIGNNEFTNGIGTTYSISDMAFGLIPGSIGETSVIAILLGAIILIVTGIGSWRIILSVFAGGLFMGGILNLFAVNALMAIPAWEHLMLGGFAFGAVYMATDPVTATQTKKGKYIYGFLIGLLAILIRVLNPAYPEGVMLAILLMNVFAPLIDHYIIEANIKRRVKRWGVDAQTN